jgi:acetyl-CoA carboxylase biotin carboxyl carrier protein
MDLSYIKKIIRLVEHSDVDEVEIEEEGKKIRVAKNRNSATGYPPQFLQVPMYQGIPAASPASPTAPIAALPAEEKPKAAEKKYHEIRSPIVGTFYRAPSPDAEPYVEVGQSVKQGDVLCIVEAMKLMNEIESDISGTIVKVAVENARPVEYSQILFYIDPA